MNELDSGDITQFELARKYSEIIEENQDIKKEIEMLKKALGDMALEKQILKTANEIYQEESRKKKLSGK